MQQSTQDETSGLFDEEELEFLSDIAEQEEDDRTQKTHKEESEADAEQGHGRGLRRVITHASAAERGMMAVCLALILLVILIVLLVPVRYTFRGQKDEEGPPRGNILLTWLLRILKVEIDINSRGVIYSVRAAGFTLTGNRPEKDKDEGKNPKEKEDRSHGQTGEKTKEKEESI